MSTARMIGIAIVGVLSILFVVLAGIPLLARVVDWYEEWLDDKLGR
jgi:hypothetical protein